MVVDPDREKPVLASRRCPDAASGETRLQLHPRADAEHGPADIEDGLAEPREHFRVRAGPRCRRAAQDDAVRGSQPDRVDLFVEPDPHRLTRRARNPLAEALEVGGARLGQQRSALGEDDLDGHAPSVVCRAHDEEVGDERRRRTKAGSARAARGGPGHLRRGYLFEFERRGYLQAGAFVPEVVLEHPELVAQLHREFVHAGSDVVEAFTYYAHREKLQTIDKEHLLEPLNRHALAIAKEVADETGTLLAGDICNTNIYVSGDSAGAVRSMFEEQVGWAVEAGVDYVVGETFTWGEEALLGLEVIKAAGLPAVITLAVHQDGTSGRAGRPRRRASDSRTRVPTSSA